MLKVIADSTLNQSFSAGSQPRSWVAQKTYNLEYGAEDLLALIHRARPGRRFRSADLVGSRRDHSDRIHLVVAGLPQRLVRVNDGRVRVLHTRRPASLGFVVINPNLRQAIPQRIPREPKQTRSLRLVTASALQRLTDHFIFP